MTSTVRGCPVTGPAGGRDGDAVDDATDACPDQYGQQPNGCPDRIGDRDGDGVLNAADNCPDKFGLADNHGCPRPDADGDGIADAKDPCPAKPGPGNGCPAPAIAANDPDADGVANVLARVDDTCYHDDDQLTDAGCQAYVQGQIKNPCGTTSLAYVLQYFGKECGGETCTPERLDSDIRSNDLGMYTDPIAIQEYAESTGLNAEIYVHRDVQDVRWFVERNIPVLLELITQPGTDSVDSGHWVVAISFCELGQGTGGTTQSHIGLFDPQGKQYTVTPEVLYQYWHDVEFQMGDAAIPLWSRLFVAVTDQSLPPGNSDQVRAQFALAQGVATGATGIQDLVDCFTEGEMERLGEGLVEVGGGLATALLGLVSNALTWGDDLPLIGGALGSLGNLGGQLTVVAEDIVNSVADLLNPSNWGDLEKLGQILGDLVSSIGEGVVALVEGVWDSIVDGIGGFFVDIWNGIKGVTCDWFGWGCPDYYSYYKHYASADPCQETFLYANGMLRKRALGYIYTSPISGTHPVYLLAAGPGPAERTYRLCADPNYTLVTPTLNLGVVGYALDAPPAGAPIGLDSRASVWGMLCASGVSFGYLLPYYQEGATPLWLFQSQESKAYAALTDPCAGTETFFGPELKGYTRDIAVGLISPSELAGGVKLYRLYNADTQDCLLSTNPQATAEGYVNQGYLGYIYTTEQPGTVPLYQFHDADHEDHLITADPGAEGLAGYGEAQALGYVAPASDVGAANVSCSVPLWRFCKRVWAEK